MTSFPSFNLAQQRRPIYPPLAVKHVVSLVSTPTVRGPIVARHTIKDVSAEHSALCCHMHIPDGYLSPSTCAVLYAGAAAAWYSALRRVKRVLTGRMIPLISVFAAFAFVIMMFNLPLPGGTTGHALGVTIAVIVLGPSGALLALSIAIAIQALFFGDGGISTLGANCFNMAVV